MMKMTNPLILIISPNCRGEKLPSIIKIKDPLPGEVTMWRKRTFPKALRIHKKKESNDAHRFFLSELLLFTAYTTETELGCDNEEECRNLYLNKMESIQYVKNHLLPFSEGLEEARYYVEELSKTEKDKRNIGDVLDPTLEQEINNSDDEDIPHPDFTIVNPDEIDIEQNISKTKKSFQNIEIKSKDELLNESRKLDKYQK